MRVDSTAEAPPDWDAFVDAHAEGTAWHRASAVAVGREAFGLAVHYVTARDAGGALAGVLPLVGQSSRLFGRFLTSVPFFNYGGILARDPAAVSALLGRARELGTAAGVRHVELRHVGEPGALPLPCRTDKISMVLPLPATEAELSKKLGAKLRSQIKRAEREKPVVQMGGEELLPVFHDVFCLTMRDLGTPSYPLRFFRAVWKAVGDRSRVLVVSAEGRPMAAAIVVRHPDRLEVPWAAAGAEAKRRSLNMRMYWELLAYAVQSGAPAFDFGRSTRDSGTYKFKAQWGAQPLPLAWYYWLPGGGELPMLNAHNPKFAMATAAWRKLPLWAARRLGPLLIRHLP